VLDKTADDMEYYLDNGDFPSEGSQVSERRSSRSEDREERPTGRRTPANTGSRRGDRF
jgi:hypothetical protein